MSDSMEFEFEVENPQIFKHLKELCKPTGIHSLNVNLEKLEKDIESSLVSVECYQKNKSEVGISYEVNPTLVETILDEYNKFLENEYHVIGDSEKIIEEFIEYVKLHSNE